MHDSQRGHGGASDVLTHKHWDEYELANIFMLAWPYGYPKIMSSYRFSDSDQGPPSAQPVDEQGNCSAEWVCEHRDPAIAAMVGFRRQVQGQPVTGWTQLNTSAIAFSRGDSGFVAINAGTSAISAQVPVGLAPGRYHDILGKDDLIVGEDQTVTISLPPMSAIATHGNQ
jgi:alpha-amylase